MAAFTFEVGLLRSEALVCPGTGLDASDSFSNLRSRSQQFKLNSSLQSRDSSIDLWRSTVAKSGNIGLLLVPNMESIFVPF